MDYFNIVPNWIFALIILSACGSTFGFLDIVGGAALPPSRTQEEFEKIQKKFHRLKGLHRNFLVSVRITLILLLMWFIPYFTINSIYVPIFVYLINTVFSVLNFFIAFSSMKYIVIEHEISEIPRYRVLFFTLGLINIVVMVASYLDHQLG